MKRIALSDFIESRYADFHALYLDILFKKTSGFLKIPMEELKFDSTLTADQFLYGDRLVILLISGPELKATLKVHYCASENESIVPANLRAACPTLEEALYSVFAELGNLVAGAMKASFLDMGYSVGISLPIAASSYDELISSDLLVRNRVYSYVGVEVAGRGRFIVTLSVDSEGAGLRAFRYQKPGDEEESDFL